MYPWNWWFSPKLYFPLSGDSIQRIAPETHWLFGTIKPEAGNGKIEQEVFENVASYGKQIGWLTELVLGLAERDTLDKSGKVAALQAMKKLESLQQQIEKVKTVESAQFEQRVTAWLSTLKAQDPDRFAQVGRTLSDILSGE
ncbi:hypothetical protein GCM10011352_30010 [Marinobacterium zhoushanense]|uniref:Uncharacterized protein n=1 Tax=Marinobacterium zhoushanense TaxID=1679163 RepID=A0ABQ1KN15_9GAMM|nr:hypothetical protein [Marinobacterium zhoushanense]GGC01863.1 hypothetical protein GCM10011352_30010 [Marinobacterium zhoushanense]